MDWLRDGLLVVAGVLIGCALTRWLDGDLWDDPIGMYEQRSAAADRGLLIGFGLGVVASLLVAQGANHGRTAHATADSGAGREGIARPRLAERADTAAGAAGEGDENDSALGPGSDH